jgi:hypothetical protein
VYVDTLRKVWSTTQRTADMTLHTTRVRGHHSCTWSPPEYGYVTWTSEYVYVDTTRVRGHHTWTSLVYVDTLRKVWSTTQRTAYMTLHTTRVRGHHSCTRSPHKYGYVTWTSEYVYVDTTRVRGHHTCTWTSLVYVDTLRKVWSTTQRTADMTLHTTRVRGHHSCTWTPCARCGARHSAQRVYATRGNAIRGRVRVRGHHSCTWSPYMYVVQEEWSTWHTWGCGMRKQPCPQGARTPLAVDRRGARGTRETAVRGSSSHISEVRVCHPPEEEVAPSGYMGATRVRDVRGAAARGSTRQHAAAAVQAWCGVDDTTHHACTLSRVRHADTRLRVQ